MKNIITSILIACTFLSCQKEKITLGTNVSETFFANNKGVNMPVHVKGNTASKLILVFVPGGPGLGGLNYRGP
jgi:hypothetical protein